MPAAVAVFVYSLAGFASNPSLLVYKSTRLAAIAKTKGLVKKKSICARGNCQEVICSQEGCLLFRLIYFIFLFLFLIL
jgi:hypothetical protein